MILHGENLIIKVDDEVIAAAKSCTIEVTAETKKVAGTTSGAWEYNISGRKSWTVTTNHLVANINDGIDLVGTSVTLSIENVQLGTSSQALPFAGTVSDAAIEDTSTTQDGDILWDDANLYFVKRVGSSALDYKYYISWQSGDDYMSPSDGDIFYNEEDGSMYEYDGSDLISMNRTGTAIVKTWRGTFTRGNLAQGSFSFLGSGALSLQ